MKHNKPNEKPLRNSRILSLGAFHTCVAYLSVIGKRFEDAGKEDLMESEIVTSGCVRGVLSGRHFNWAKRAHKIA